MNAALEFCERVTRDDLEVSGECLARLREHFSEAEIVELTTVDLHYVHDFDIYLTTAQEYEGLVRQIFPLLHLGGGGVRSAGSAG